MSVENTLSNPLIPEIYPANETRFAEGAVLIGDRHLNYESLWLERSSREVAAPRRLFCFPYTGGDARFFRGWQRQLALEVEVCPVHLPGLERRFGEPVFTRLEKLVDAVSQAIRWKGKTHLRSTATVWAP